MNPLGISEEKSTKPYIEFDDAEDTLKGMTLEAGRWRFGARCIDLAKDLWRPILQVDALDYDILLPGHPMSKEHAVREAVAWAYEFGGVPMAPEGAA